MQYSRIISFFLVLLSFGIVALGNPTVKRQDTTSVETVFNNLQSSTNSILPQLTTLGNSGTATDDSITPLINELTAALNTAKSSLGTIDPASIEKRETLDAVAILIAGIVEDIARTLDILVIEAARFPVLHGLIVDVDVALHEVLTAVDIILVGVSVLLNGLLVDVAVLLNSVGLTLTLGVLGLLGILGL